MGAAASVGTEPVAWLPGALEALGPAFRLCVLALLAWAMLPVRTATADTLAAALSRAVANFPEVRAARANRRAIEESVTQARGAWFPTIDASLGHGRETSNNASTRALGANQTLTRREAEVSLSQLLFDGGAASAQVRRFEARVAGASGLLGSAAEAAGARVAQTYLDVIRLRALIAIGFDNEKRHRETLAQVTQLADAGQGRRADAQQADARLALAQASLTQLRNQLAQAEAAFLHLTGQPPGLLAEPDGLTTRLPGTLPAALAHALETHPAIRAAHNDLVAAQADRESARSRAVAPRVALEVGTSAHSDLDGIRGPNSDAFAMLRLRYNLYRGGIDNARVRETEARIDEARANLDKARNDTERDLRQAWESLVEDRIRLPQLQRYAAASAQVVTSYRLQFSIGQRSLLDVLNAENELFAAKSSQTTAESAVRVDEYRLLAAMGRLLETLGVDLEQAPQGRPDEPRRAAMLEARTDRDARALPPAGGLRMATSLGSVAAAQ